MAKFSPLKMVIKFKNDFKIKTLKLLMHLEYRMSDKNSLEAVKKGAAK